MFLGRWFWITAQDRACAISKQVDTKCVIADGKCALLAWTLVMTDFGHVSDHAQVCRHPTAVSCFFPFSNIVRFAELLVEIRKKKSESSV